MVADLSPPYADASFWLETSGDDLTPRAPLPGDRGYDVAIVGAGYTGLWTAYHLRRLDPTLRVVVLEREIAGYGASGRNGGWCSALFAAPWPRVAKAHGRDAALRLRRALERTVDEVGEWCAEHDVDAHYEKGGTLTVARGPAQVARAKEAIAVDRDHGGGDTEWLDADATRARVAVSGADAAVFTPHCAAVHPGRLVRGLARVVDALGVDVFEQTPVTAIAPGSVSTTRGKVRADVVIRATEAYTAGLPGHTRQLAPLWSLLVATEPLPDQFWAELGWGRRETVGDERHLLVYAQRTDDGRIALGGRGAPYRFGSRTEGDAGHVRTHARLERELHTLFPGTRDARITHRWGGVLGVSRDWSPSVGYDAARGFGWAGGYVGDGVGCSALAGRTVADLVLGRDTDEAALPWVGHRWRSWEPEPLRWLGIRAATAAMAVADATESRTGRRSRLAGLVGRLTGG